MWIYHHDLDPFLLGPFSVGSFHNIGVRWYSLAYIVGFLWVYAVLYRTVLRRRLPNADLERLEEACLILICAIILGGRLGYFILNEPWRLLTWQGWKDLPRVWQGGMAFFGAAVAVFGTEYWYCRKNKVGFWHGSDRFVWVLAFSLGFGRVANFINGELWGVPTNGHWGVLFPQSIVDGPVVPRHPVQLYEALSHWLLGFYLLWLLRRKPHTPFDRVPGFTCFHFLVGYGILRAITDHWRPERVNFGPITGGQALSLALAVIGLIGAQVRYRMIRKYGGELDYYPEDGVDGALPDEVHAHIDAINAERRAREAAKAAETAAK